MLSSYLRKQEVQRDESKGDYVVYALSSKVRGLSCNRYACDVVGYSLRDRHKLLSNSEHGVSFLCVAMVVTMVCATTSITPCGGVPARITIIKNIKFKDDKVQKQEVVASGNALTVYQRAPSRISIGTTALPICHCQAHSVTYALSHYVLYALSQYVLYALSQYVLYALMSELAETVSKHTTSVERIKKKLQKKLDRVENPGYEALFRSMEEDVTRVSGWAQTAIISCLERLSKMQQEAACGGHEQQFERMRKVQQDARQKKEDTNPSVDTSLNHKEDDQEIDEPQSDINPIRKSSRTRRAPDRMCLYIDVVTPPEIRTTQRNGNIGVLLQGTKHKSRKTTLKWTF
ncbi:hypothetical protein Tco_0754788 [Tanacetum coccineum]